MSGMDIRMARLQLLVCVQQGMYVAVEQHHHFAFRSSTPSHGTGSSAAAAHRPAPLQLLDVMVLPAPECDREQLEDVLLSTSGGAAVLPAAGGCKITGREQDELHECQSGVELHWALSAYQRVFLSEEAARNWASWNAARGDPAQPFHVMHAIAAARADMAKCEASDDLVGAHKLLLLAGAVMQDSELIAGASRGMQSAAQDLRCLRVCVYVCVMHVSVRMYACIMCNALCIVCAPSSQLSIIQSRENRRPILFLQQLFSQNTNHHTPCCCNRTWALPFDSCWRLHCRATSKPSARRSVCEHCCCCSVGACCGQRRHTGTASSVGLLLPLHASWNRCVAAHWQAVLQALKQPSQHRTPCVCWHRLTSGCCHAR